MKILIISHISPDSVEELRKRHDVVCKLNAPPGELKELIRDREALVFRSGVSISSELMTCAPGLRLLIRAGSGFDNIDMDYVERMDISFERIPGPAAKAVGEMSFALMLSLARNIVQADRLLRQGRWAKTEMNGVLLVGKVLGIVGAGNIGSRVGELGVAWGMKVIGCVDKPAPAIGAELAKKGIQLADFMTVMEDSDFVSVHVPFDETTRNLIDANALSRMKPGSFLVNLSRGGVVDEDALYKALVAGKTLRGAALDVHRVEGEGHISPLAALPNVILTPHIGSQTTDSQREIGLRVTEIVDAFEAALRGKKRNVNVGSM